MRKITSTQEINGLLNANHGRSDVSEGRNAGKRLAREGLGPIRQKGAMTEQQIHDEIDRYIAKNYENRTPTYRQFWREGYLTVLNQMSDEDRLAAHAALRQKKNNDRKNRVHSHRSHPYAASASVVEQNFLNEQQPFTENDEKVAEMLNGLQNIPSVKRI